MHNFLNFSCKTRYRHRLPPPPPPPLEKKKRAEAQDDDNNAPPRGPENEQHIEDAETLKMTEEQRLSLFHSFRSVKFEWSDLDSNDTACALCAAATMQPPRSTEFRILICLVFASAMQVPAVAAAPPPGPPASTAARPQDADALKNQDEPPRRRKRARPSTASSPSPPRPPLARRMRFACRARHSQKSRRAAQVKSLPALGFTVSPPAPLGSVRKLERKRRTATTLLRDQYYFMNISTLYSSNILISIHNTGAKRRPTMHKPLLSGEKGQGVEL
ncbi:hypothetical protein DFH09DRAFT_1091607 [Mycena vulgaris]|nr:hypothetical protein DFH09DRAFT_1091607 [Mycena vulgaris]